MWASSVLVPLDTGIHAVNFNTREMQDNIPGKRLPRISGMVIQSWVARVCVPVNKDKRLWNSTKAL